MISSENLIYRCHYRLAEAIRYIMLDILFYQLLVCAVIIAFNLFGLETATLDMHTFLAAAELIDTVILTYIYCYLSEQITSDLVDIGDIFYGSDWYGMPVKFQKLVALPILRSQREIQLSGLELIDCTLTIYLSVSLEFPFLSISWLRMRYFSENLLIIDDYGFFSSSEQLDRTFCLCEASNIFSQYHFGVLMNVQQRQQQQQ